MLAACGAMPLASGALLVGSALFAGGTLLAGSALFVGSAWAQDYPSRPINMVIPFPPGGNTDLMARALQPELAKALGQAVIVINKGGAGGTLGNIEVGGA